MQKLLDWVKANPPVVFIGGIVLLIVLVLIFAPKTNTQTQTPNMSQQTTQSDKSGGIVLKTLQIYKNVPLLINNYARCYGIEDNRLRTLALSGREVKDGFVIQAQKPDTVSQISPDNSPSSIVIPITQDIAELSFKISQEQPDADMTNYAYGTKVEVLIDGVTNQSIDITKDSLLINDITVDAKGAKQVTIKVSTSGKKVNEFDVEDQYGPWFPLIISDFQVHKIQQEAK